MPRGRQGTATDLPALLGSARRELQTCSMTHIMHVSERTRLAGSGLSAAATVLGASAVWFGSAYCAFDDSGNASNTRVHGEGILRTVDLTCTTFHARIQINDLRLAGGRFEDIMWTHIPTHTAAVASGLIEVKGRNAGKIAECCCHVDLLASFWL